MAGAPGSKKPVYSLLPIVSEAWIDGFAVALSFRRLRRAALPIRQVKHLHSRWRIQDELFRFQRFVQLQRDHRQPNVVLLLWPRDLNMTWEAYPVVVFEIRIVGRRRYIPLPVVDDLPVRR